MSLFGQGVDARICSVTMATAFENVNLHVQIRSYHYSASFRYYFSCFTFLSLLLCIPREWDANLHVSIAIATEDGFPLVVIKYAINNFDF